MMNASLDHYPQDLNMVSPTYCYPVLSPLETNQFLSSSSSSSLLLQAEDMLTDQPPSLNQTIVSKIIILFRVLRCQLLSHLNICTVM